MKKLLAIYSIFIGITMIGIWIMLLAMDQVPEVHTEPIRIAGHIIAEVLTAVMLLGAGYGLLKKYKWAPMVSMVSQGMLLYTVIASGGYYAQKGDVVMTSMFATYTVLTSVFIVLLLRDTLLKTND